MSDDVALSAKQLDFMRGSSARVCILEGSIRSGKTIVSLLRWFLFLATAPRGGELVMIGRTRDALFRNVIKPMQDPSLFGPLAAQVAYTNGASTATILGRTVHVIGASDAKAEKVIRGMTVAGAYVDEVTVIPEEFFTQLLGRMSVRGAQLFGTTNPDSPAHWLKRKFLDRLHTLPDWRSWHFTIDDNPSLTEAYKASIRAEFTGLWFRRFILGEWVAAEGAVYDMWSPEDHVVPWADLPAMEQLLGVGVDYGTTNASTGLLLGLGVDRRLYLVDEWRVDPQQATSRLTDAQLSASFRTWLAEQHVPQITAPMAPRFVVVDPAAASFRLQLFHDGIRNVQSADNDVAYGIRTVASGLAGGWLKVSDRCQGFITEAPGYSWDPKATEKGEDKPLKVADHSLDGGRYAVTTLEPLWRGRINDSPRPIAA